MASDQQQCAVHPPLLRDPHTMAMRRLYDKHTTGAHSVFLSLWGKKRESTFRGSSFAPRRPYSNSPLGGNPERSEYFAEGMLA